MQKDPSIMYSCYKTQVHQIQIVCTDSLSLHIANNSAQQWNATAHCLINCIWQGFIFSCIGTTILSDALQSVQICRVKSPWRSCRLMLHIRQILSPDLHLAKFTSCCLFVSAVSQMILWYFFALSWSVWHSDRYHVSHSLQHLLDSAWTQWRPYHTKIEAAVSITVKSSTVYFPARRGGGRAFHVVCKKRDVHCSKASLPQEDICNVQNTAEVYEKCK